MAERRRGQLRIGLDATPLLGPRSGVGRYVASLLRALVATAEDGGEGAPVRNADEYVATAFTLRGRRALPEALPAGVRAVGPPIPARLAQRAWRRFDHPSITRLLGPLDVFHATNFVLPPTGSAAGVVTVHDLSFLRTPHTVSAASLAYRDLVPRSIQRAAVVLTPSRAVAAEIAETYRVPADRLTVTHLGVDDAWFHTPPPDTAARRRLALPERYLVFAGNLEPRKNLPLLLDAYRAALATDSGLPALALVGPSGWGPALDTGHIPRDRILFLGYRGDEDLRGIVAGAQALLYPSAYEGFGLPPLEAFACGVPVIASDLPVIDEVLGPDRSLSTRVPVGDVAALADALLRHACAAGEPGATEAGRARRERARLFTWRATAETTHRAYVSAIA